MIELKGVSLRFKGSETDTLKDVNFSIAKGEFCLLLGPSGAGKSSLLRMLFGSLRPSSGSIAFNNQSLLSLSKGKMPYVRRQIGFVFQDFRLIEHRSVFDNVALSLVVKGQYNDRQIKAKVYEVLNSVGLNHRVDAPCYRLSGGEKQRVAIARAIVGRPLLLLCDEPTGNLDKKRAQEIVELLMKTCAQGATVLVATHDPGLFERYHRRALALVDGRVVESNL